MTNSSSQSPVRALTFAQEMVELGRQLKEVNSSDERMVYVPEMVQRLFGVNNYEPVWLVEMLGGEIEREVLRDGGLTANWPQAFWPHHGQTLVIGGLKESYREILRARKLLAMVGIAPSPFVLGVVGYCNWIFDGTYDFLFE